VLEIVPGEFVKPTDDLILLKFRVPWLVAPVSGDTAPPDDDDLPACVQVNQSAQLTIQLRTGFPCNQWLDMLAQLGAEIGVVSLFK
jgi:hypothetical protein